MYNTHVFSLVLISKIIIVFIIGILILYINFLFPKINLDEQSRFPPDVLVLTVATEPTDGFKRYIRSTSHFHIPVQIIGMGEKWEGGNMKYKGGGHKVNLLRKALKPYKLDKDRIVLFTDSFDVVFVSNLEMIIDKFKKMNSRLVFSSEVYCWPKSNLADDYPPSDGEYKYLNSGGFIGYAADLYDILRSHLISNTDDDQLFYTEIYLNKKIRDQYNIKIDHNSSIFQSIFGAEDDLKLITTSKGFGSYLQNTATGTEPLIVHGNGISKLYLNSIGNYIGGGWDDKNGCFYCNSYDPNIPDQSIVVMAIFIYENTPFLTEFFENIANLKYPSTKLHLFLYNNIETSENNVNTFVQENKDKYVSIKRILPNDNVDESQARELAMEYCIKKDCGYLFSIDSVSQIKRPETISRLIQQNKSVIGPMISKYKSAFSNFWGAIDSKGFYARSFDYFDIVNEDRKGVWNVAYLAKCYLINGTLLKELKGSYISELDPDMAFSSHLRDKGIFMFVDNTIDYGHMINTDSFDPKLTNPELYLINDNQLDWEKRYLHENYTSLLKTETPILQPCPDVYWFPIMTPRFCKELIEVMEAFGKWSSGTNNDERLEGGYESVPTRDIHMKQVGFEKQWLYIIGEYVRPIQEKVFTGYFHDPPKAIMNFVVRYKPDEQPSLRPHHDSSTYTINLALNRPLIDYTGGGCHFLRYNCSVTNTKIGWMLMHPGRLTHFHEGLKVTSGTRYIMISFVDP